MEVIGSILDFYFDGPQEPPSLQTVVREKKRALRIKKEDPFRKYKKSDLLGEGGMGKVFKVVDKETGEVCAAKTMKVENVKMVGWEICRRYFCGAWYRSCEVLIRGVGEK